MNQNDIMELRTERLFQYIKRLIYENRYPILGTYIAGILAFTFAFTNKLPNADDLCSLFGKGAALESGRWGLSVLSLVFPDYSMPWIYGILSLAIISAGSCMIVRIFTIENSVLQFLLAALITVFPSQISTFSYMFTACAYAIAFYLSILAAYLGCKRGKYGNVLSIFCIILSASIYQAYIAITATFFILILIQSLLRHQKSTKSIWSEGIKYIVLLTTSLAVYWVISKVLWNATGTPIGLYADSALVFDISTIFEGIKNAYLHFWRIIRYRSHGLIPNKFSHYVHYACAALACVEILIWILRRRKASEVILLIFLLALLPLSINVTAQ